MTIETATVGDPGNPSVGVVQTFGGPKGEFVDPPKGTGIYKTCGDAPAAPPPCITVGAVKDTFGIGEFEITDERYRDHFSKFPFANGFLGVVRMLPAQIRHATGEIRIPDGAISGDYDLVVIGSPTWWLTTSIPVRSFLKSDDADALLGGTRFTSFVVCRRYFGFNLRTVKKLGTKHGGEWVDGTEFTYPGGQIRSLLSLISFLGSGEQRGRYLGIKIPPTNLQPEHLVQAREFAAKLPLE
ncbi:MAG: flavodoxin family protein [Solirubrobacterales bacterium]|nr:flavodoxin family protein [Solirubrobacterales bacterium]